MKYFISGHRDITKDEFDYYYVPEIKNILDNEQLNAEFVIGDYQGVDTPRMVKR